MGKGKYQAFCPRCNADIDDLGVLDVEVNKRMLYVANDGTIAWADVYDGGDDEQYKEVARLFTSPYFCVNCGEHFKEEDIRIEFIPAPEPELRAGRPRLLQDSAGIWYRVEREKGTLLSSRDGKFWEEYNVGPVTQERIEIWSLLFENPTLEEEEIGDAPEEEQ